MFIRDGERLIQVKVLRPEVELRAELPTRSPLDKWREAWAKSEDRFDKPHHHWQAEDYGIAQRMLAKYGVERLTSGLEVFFWFHWVDGYPHRLRLFAAAWPEIENYLDRMRRPPATVLWLLANAGH